MGGDVLQLRVPGQRVPPAPAAPAGAASGVLPEPEIHARLVEALGLVTEDDLAPLRAAAAEGRAQFAEAFFAATAANPTLGALAPIVLYRTLGPTLPDGAASAAILWGAAHRCAMSFPDSVRRAGFEGEGLELGERLFDAVLASPSGVRFTVDEYEDSWRRVRTEDGRFHLAIPELLDELAHAATSPRRPTPPTRSSSRPASGGRSRPTRSSATRPGASGTPAARCACTRPTRRASASPTADGPA